MIIRPDTTKLFPLYLKAFLEFLPSDIVIKELKLTSKKHLLSKGSLSKLLVPLPPVTEQIALSDKYDKVKTVDFYHRYANPIIEQYDIQSSNVVGKENIRSLMDNWHRLFISKS